MGCLGSAPPLLDLGMSVAMHAWGQGLEEAVFTVGASDGNSRVLLGLAWGHRPTSEPPSFTQPENKLRGGSL